jgi:hypothetical protein
MNVDHILDCLNRRRVAYLLIGGMNFLLRHAPVLTFDVDLWIEDTAENRCRCEVALSELDAQWGRADEDWGPVSAKSPGWLDGQVVFCLNSPHGAIDVFRVVPGLPDWSSSWVAAVAEETSSGVAYRGISDADMLRCQLALDEPMRKKDRIATLEAALRRTRDGDD